MKNKLKVIIPVVIAVIAIVIAVLCINFKPEEMTNVSTNISTAQKYLIEQNYEQAIAEFEKIIELDPMNADAYIGIAEAYESMGNTDKAIEWLEKGYELTGDGRLKDMLDKLKSREFPVETTVSETVPISEAAPLTAPKNEIINNEDGSYYEMAFNTNGKIIHEDFYDESGKCFGYADIEYYPDGKIKTQKYYREDRSYYVSEYDTDEKIIKKTNYNSDGSIYYYEIYEYDSNDNMILNTSYYDDNSIRAFSKYKYDSNNYKIYIEQYDSIRYRKEAYTNENMWNDETMAWNIKYNDEYTICYIYASNNDSGALSITEGIKECYYYNYDTEWDDIEYCHFINECNDNMDIVMQRTYLKYPDQKAEKDFGYTEYFYNDENNVISSKEYRENSENEAFELIPYKINTYDGLGNIITSTAYNADGSIYWQNKY